MALDFQAHHDELGGSRRSFRVPSIPSRQSANVSGLMVGSTQQPNSSSLPRAQNKSGLGKKILMGTKEHGYVRRGIQGLSPKVQSESTHNLTNHVMSSSHVKAVESERAMKPRPRGGPTASSAISAQIFGESNLNLGNLAPKQEGFSFFGSGRRESSKPKIPLSKKPPRFNNRQLQKKLSTSNLTDQPAAQKPPSLFVQQIKAAQKIESNIAKGKQMSSSHLKPHDLLNQQSVPTQNISFSGWRKEDQQIRKNMKVPRPISSKMKNAQQQTSRAASAKSRASLQSGGSFQKSQAELPMLPGISGSGLQVGPKTVHWEEKQPEAQKPISRGQQQPLADSGPSDFDLKMIQEYQNKMKVRQHKKPFQNYNSLTSGAAGGPVSGTGPAQPPPMAAKTPVSSEQQRQKMQMPPKPAMPLKPAFASQPASQRIGGGLPGPGGSIASNISAQIAKCKQPEETKIPFDPRALEKQQAEQDYDAYLKEPPPFNYDVKAKRPPGGPSFCGIYSGQEANPHTKAKAQVFRKDLFSKLRQMGGGQV